MLWSYSGELTVHTADGWDTQQVSDVFELPDRNVELIREFLYANKDYILECKYRPQSGEAPWGDVQAQINMRSELAARMPDEEWLVGVTDRQVKSCLVAFYHHLLENLDVYSPSPTPDRGMIAA